MDDLKWSYRLQIHQNRICYDFYLSARYSDGNENDQNRQNQNTFVNVYFINLYKKKNFGTKYVIFMTFLSYKNRTKMFQNMEIYGFLPIPKYRRWGSKTCFFQEISRFFPRSKIIKKCNFYNLSFFEKGVERHETINLQKKYIKINDFCRFCNFSFGGLIFKIQKNTKK